MRRQQRASSRLNIGDVIRSLAVPILPRYGSSNGGHRDSYEGHPESCGCSHFGCRTGLQPYLSGLRHSLEQKCPTVERAAQCGPAWPRLR